MMVALIIVSVGLLGVATLQTRGQQFNQVSYFRTQAALLATDIMERIRINTDRIQNSDGNGDNGSYQIGSCDKYLFSSACDAGGCSPAQLATYDLNQWCAQVTHPQTLPQGQAIIQFDNRIYTIYICWKNIVDSKQDNEICTDDEMEEQKWVLQI